MTGPELGLRLESALELGLGSESGSGSGKSLEWGKERGSEKDVRVRD